MILNFFFFFFFVSSFVSLLICVHLVITATQLGLKGPHFWGFNRGHPRDTITKLDENQDVYYLLPNNGDKGLKFTGFNEAHTRVVIRKFGEDWSKILPIRLLFFFSKFPGYGHNSKPQ